MELKLTINKDQVGQYILTLINGLAVNLSERELVVMSEFINLDIRYKQMNAYSLPGIALLSTNSRKEVREKVEISQHNLNNILSSLKEKKMFIEVEKTWVLTPVLRELVKNLEKAKKNVIISFNFTLS